MSNYKLGRQGEQEALAFLIAGGYEHVRSNYRAKFGELDLIMKKDETLIIVEVKASSSYSHGRPCERVNAQKQRRMIKLALHFIQSTGWDGNIRFDVIEKLPSGMLNHIERAFDLSDIGYA